MNTPPDIDVVSQFDVLASSEQRGCCWHWLYEMRAPLAEDTLLCEAAGQAQSNLLNALLKPGQEHDFRQLCRDLTLAGDLEAVCAAHLAGIASVFESGRDFGEFQFWLDASATIFDRTQDVSAKGRAALLLHCSIAELLGRGNLLQARHDLTQLARLAEQANCDALRICHAATRAYLEIMSGRLLVADAIVSDALHLSPQPHTHPLPKLYLQAIHGLLSNLCGHPVQTCAPFEAVARQHLFDQCPASLWLFCMGQMLVSLASSAAEPSELAACAEKIRARSIPQHKHYHRGCLHYGLGAAALIAGQPETALFHAQTAAELSRLSQSVTTQRTSALLEIQALNDLSRHAEALRMLDQQVQGWSQAGAHMLVSSAFIEEASLLLYQGRVAQARNALQRAHLALPPGECLPHNLRSNHFISALSCRLGPQQAPTGRHDNGGYPVQITTFGELRVVINGRTLYDRDWHGNRSKTLLKALIVLGGHKVSAERLSDLLWPDADGDVARNNLKVSLWRLRRLGCDKGETPLPWIAVQHGHVSLVSGLCQVDCIGFEQDLQVALEMGVAESIERVLARFSSNFLANDDSTNWIIQHREHLMQHYLNAVYALTETALKHPSHFDPVPLLETTLQLAPHDNRSRQLLTRLLSVGM